MPANVPTATTEPGQPLDASKGPEPWLRLLLVMTVPVLLLLVGISLTR
ncbi:MAG TPA: hypothetical protein VGJ89_11400 [Geothrix sp.]|jgi:hypothetical protein